MAVFNYVFGENILKNLKGSIPMIPTVIERMISIGTLRVLPRLKSFNPLFIRNWSPKKI